MAVILNPHVQERLSSDEMIWLVSVRPDGRPHSVPVWFLWEGAALLIFSKPNTQKIRNVRQNQYVTVTLDDTKGGHDVVILEGSAALLERGEGHEVLQAYGQKYREGLQRIGVTAEQFSMLYSQPIRIIPIRLLAGQ